MIDPKCKTILVVDDDNDLRETMMADLEHQGYKVLGAANGREAFEAALNNKVDLVISDIRMPGGDGVELLDRLKDHNVEVPVVVLVTGFSDLSLEQAYHKGANALFLKPFDRKLLHQVIQQNLDDRNQRWLRQEFAMNVDFKIELKILNTEEIIEGKVLALGRGGMFVSLNGTIPNVGEAVWFKFSYVQSGFPHLEGQGRARWVRPDATPEMPAGFGLEFTCLNAAMNELVNQIITDKKIKPYIPKGKLLNHK